jgi:hypothetical protein
MDSWAQKHRKVWNFVAHFFAQKRQNTQVVQICQFQAKKTRAKKVFKKHCWLLGGELAIINKHRPNCNCGPKSSCLFGPTLKTARQIWARRLYLTYFRVRRRYNRNFRPTHSSDAERQAADRRRVGRHGWCHTDKQDILLLLLRQTCERVTRHFSSSR